MRLILFIFDVLVILAIVGGLYLAYLQGKEDATKDNLRKGVK